MELLFLHLSDMHIRYEKDISDLHLSKIVESLKCYRTEFKNIILIISGDLADSGEKAQFDNIRKIVGSLIKNIRDTFRECWVHILVVPGNHDVMHNSKPLSVGDIKNGNYESIETREYCKLKHFYDFAKVNKCFEDSNIYFCKRIIDIDGLKIQANLINNAIYSTTDEYKGLLYIPNDRIEELALSSSADFTITVMHHSPDFFKDEIKNIVEEKVIGKSSILFYGHEHINGYRRISYDGSSSVVVQLGGCLCKLGNWDASSYRVGIFNTETKEYNYHKFTWNITSRQYEHDKVSKDLIIQHASSLAISSEFLNYIYDEDFKKDYYVFPKVLLHSQKPENTKQFESFDSFRSELLHYNRVIITGASNIGKSILLKKLFEVLNKDYIVLFCSPDILLHKSKNKQQNIDKLTKDLFKDIYGDNDSLWQSFERCDQNKCIFIFDDFDQTEVIDINNFMEKLGERFGTIIISSSRTIDFDPADVIVSENDKIAKFEIKPMLGNKMKQLIESVVRKKADDKSDLTVSNTVDQINRVIKSQINLIPPEPYFLIQVTENYINNIGEAINSSTNVFSKVFEANITHKIDAAIKKSKKNITVDKIYVLMGKIGYYIHFNKAYPINRRTIDEIIQYYNFEHGDDLITEDILLIAKKSKLLIVSAENSEAFRFGNKSLLAYFAAKEIISKYQDTKDNVDIINIMNTCCINICTDILFFIIFQTDDISILRNIIEFIYNTVNSNDDWKEFDIPSNIPRFLNNTVITDDMSTPINIKEERKHLEESEEAAVSAMVDEFKIKDIYDWDDANIENFNNQLIRMTSLLHIVSRSLPCFEHKLKKTDKELLIEYLYRLPNMIFSFWSKSIDENLDDITKELKLLPYFTSKNSKKLNEKQIDSKIRELLSMHSIDLLLNLYYIPVINASDKNTSRYLINTDIFDYTQKSTYLLEHLMILEQIKTDEFVTRAIRLNDDLKHHIPVRMLRWIVHHGIITRNDSKANINKLEDKFFSSKAKLPFLIEKAKNKE